MGIYKEIDIDKKALEMELIGINKDIEYNDEKINRYTGTTKKFRSLLEFYKDEIAIASLDESRALILLARNIESDLTDNERWLKEYTIKKNINIKRALKVNIELEQVMNQNE